MKFSTKFYQKYLQIEGVTHDIDIPQFISDIVIRCEYDRIYVKSFKDNKISVARLDRSINNNGVAIINIDIVKFHYASRDTCFKKLRFEVINPFDIIMDVYVYDESNTLYENWYNDLHWMIDGKSDWYPYEIT